MNDTKTLWLLFAVTIQICLIIFFFSAPKNYHITLYRLENWWSSSSTSLGRAFPNFRIYNNKTSYDVKTVLSKRDIHIIIVDGCTCKEELLNKWIKNAKTNDTKIIYIYTEKEKFYDDKLAKNNKNISVYMCSDADILSFFKSGDIVDFPIAYTVNNKGEIIAKEE